MESLPHPINENSNQSLLTNNHKKYDEAQLSQQYDQLQSPHNGSCGMSFFQSLGGRGPAPHNDSFTHSTFNDSGIIVGKKLFKNSFCLGGRKETQTTSSNVASLKRYGGLQGSTIW